MVRRVWETAVSPSTFVVLSILWCLDLAVGSLVAYRADPRFWIRMDAYPFNLWLRQVAPLEWPRSLWVYILVVLTYLVVASLVLCTVNWFFRKRRRLRGMGEVLVHLGFLFVFAGFVLGSGFGSRVQGLRVAEGEEAPVGQGLALRVERVDVVRGPGGRAWDAVSRVTLVQHGQVVARGTVRTNHPLIHGATVVYPQGASARVAGVVLATTRGTVRLRPGAGAPVGADGVLRIRALLDPGERWGPYIGPGAVVELRGADEAVRGSVFLSPGTRGVVNLAGLRVRLLDLEVVPGGVYNVHRDPGVWLVLVGACVLTLGTFWALAGYLVRRPASA